MAQEKILSPVTGGVWQLTATVGSTLAADDTVLLLESMKMEIPVTMPRAGRLLSLKVKEGDAVSEGQVLAEIE